jgi:hypothetical protein
MYMYLFQNPNEDFFQIHWDSKQDRLLFYTEENREQSSQKCIHLKPINANKINSKRKHIKMNLPAEKRVSKVKIFSCKQ